MSRVTHASIEEGTYHYKGPALMNWTQNSQLINVIMAIQAEFNAAPPAPQRASAAQPMPAGGQVQQNPQQPQRVARPQYQPQPEVIKRPALTAVKQRIDQ